MLAVRVRDQARANWLARSILSGFTASMAMFLAFIVAYAVASILPTIQLAGRRGAEVFHQWFVALTNNALIDLARPNLYAAIAVHLAVGLLFAVLYARFFEPRLSGPGWLRGVQFSMLPWLLSLIAFFPMLGAGPFGLALGAGPLPAIGNLILHLVYGATLGALYGPWGDLVTDSSLAPPTGDDVLGMERSERAAATGTVGGLVLGLLVGLGGTLVEGATDGDLIPGMHPLVFLVGSALLGGSFGALLGSFLGLPAPREG